MNYGSLVGQKNRCLTQTIVWRRFHTSKHGLNQSRKVWMFGPNEQSDIKLILVFCSCICKKQKKQLQTNPLMLTERRWSRHELLVYKEFDPFLTLLSVTGVQTNHHWTQINDHICSDQTITSIFLKFYFRGTKIYYWFVYPHGPSHDAFCVNTGNKSWFVDFDSCVQGSQIIIFISLLRRIS